MVAPILTRLYTTHILFCIIPFPKFHLCIIFYCSMVMRVNWVRHLLLKCKSCQMRGDFIFLFFTIFWTNDYGKHRISTLTVFAQTLKLNTKSFTNSIARYDAKKKKCRISHYMFTVFLLLYNSLGFFELAIFSCVSKWWNLRTPSVLTRVNSFTTLVFYAWLRWTWHFLRSSFLLTPLSLKL